MGICFADSLKKYQEENMKPDDGTENNGSSSPTPDDSQGVVQDIFDGLGVIDPMDTWIQITDQEYEFYDDYNCDDVSAVLNSKKIVLKPDQMSFAQESNSQYIPFQMPRFFDGYDMAKTKIHFYYVNRDGQYGIDYAVNVYASDTKIRFAWLVSSSVTKLSGNVRFEIRATGYNSNGKPYMWKTYPNNEINIEESLSAGVYIEPDETWQENFYLDLDNRMNHVLDLFADAEESAKEANKVSKEAVDAVWLARSEAEEIIEEIKDSAEESVNNTKEEAETFINNTKTSAVNEVAAVKAEVLSAAAVAKDEMSDLRKNVDTLVEDIYEERSTETINTKVAEAMGNYHTKQEIVNITAGIAGELENIMNVISELDGLAKFDVTYDGSKMTFYNGTQVIKEIYINSDPSEEWTSKYTNSIDGKIGDAVDVLNKTIEDHVKNAEETYATKASVISIGDSTKEFSAHIETNKTNIATLGDKMVELEKIVSEVDTAPRVTYDITYDEEYRLSLWEQEGDDESTRAVKSQVVIQGGAGGTNTSTVLTIERITPSPYTTTVNDDVIISYIFSGEDSSGDQVMEATATWKVNGTIVSVETIEAGINTFDATPYLTGAGTHTVSMSVIDEAGTIVPKSWKIKVLDVRLESTFNDSITYSAPFVFDYTPYGSIAKVIHFTLDGVEIGTVETSMSGIPTGFPIPEQSHGAHLLDVYMTADMDGDGVDDLFSNHITKDIIWLDESSTVPVIGCVMQNFTAMQYDTTNIIYTVHDPSTETPTVILSVDGEAISTQKLYRSTDTWQYRSSDVGDHVLTIQCGDTIKVLNVTIEKLNIDVEPVTTGLAFDFNPVGRFNSDADRLWSYGDISMSVSPNFDWTNGGYQLDSNGDQYFCIKAGTQAVINYKLFEDDAKRNGKEFKLIFKSANVQRSDATFLTCMDNTTESDHIGIQMDVHEARIYGQAGNLSLPYSENDIIEFEFNISKNTEAVPMVIGYEDGVSTRPMVYDGSFDFTQVTPQYITLGSDACDLHIYRFKVYNTSLNARNIMSNFITDARNSDEMLKRYNRNRIYDDNQNLTPDILAERCPWLRVYKLSAPYFTNNKSDKVPNTTIQQIFKDGDPVLDNWTCYNAMHSGQGTSSNNYGASGRNLDFIMNNSGVVGVDPYFILGNGAEVSEITMTRTSVPTAYLNAKVNIASSNNMTNALLANRYNKFNPYRRPFVRAEGEDIRFIKDTMEFFNCVIFIQETDTDISTHREFADCNWHFYAIGNIGDSKKTDDTRLTDPDDEYECCVEIMDVELPLSDFPVNTIIDAMGYEIDKKTGEKIYLWAKDENLDILLEKVDDEYVPTEDLTVDLSKTYYVDALEHDDFSEDFTYGWRYIYENDSDEEKTKEVFDFCKQKWIDFYRFVTTSSDEDFKAHLKDYFVIDSALYYYLFTTRYCMVDNRAKNTFWHYGKTGETDASGNPIRKWDLCWDYDNDTSLGLNNYGKQVYRHGLEDIDKDEKGEEVFRESDSTFFCRVRDLFDNELRAMYNTLESQNAWHAESFINQADAWQEQFPEELWRIDIERKYIRTYNESFINGKGDAQFLTNMCNGRMKYHRRQWERAQEKYMASKYQSSVASSDNAVLRCTVPTGDLAIQPNYKLKLTPYDYMYLNVKYGTQSPIQIRANPGVEYEIPFTGSSADIIDIYSSSIIQSFGDLSACYPATVDTSKASKIKELIIGNDTEGYSNPGLTSLTLGANDLLEVLNIENVSGLTQALDVSVLHNLRELYAHGSNVGGVTFAPGGRIEIAELPAISSMNIRNLMYLIDLDVTSFDKLTRLVAENCSTVDVQSIVNASPKLNRARILGIDWNLENTGLLDRLYAMSGIDKDGYNTSHAVITGRVHVPVIRQRQLQEYSEVWPDLEIGYSSLIEQFAVTFKNDNGDIVEVQYVDKGGDAIDPTSRADNPIVMTKESTVSHYFTFAGWDSSLNEVFGDRVITATYTSALREYTLKYASKGIVLQESKGLYGEIIPYTGDRPTYTGEEDAYVYHLFKRWSDTGTVTGNKTIEAIYDRFEYREGVFDGKKLADLSPVQIYAMVKLGLSNSVVSDKDPFSFSLGNDFTYNDIKSDIIIEEPIYFDGSTSMNTGIKLFDTDKSFVLAIDYEFLEGNTTNSVLAQCYQSNGFLGFKLGYIKNPTIGAYTGARLMWGSVSNNLVSENKREMLVIRHIKGDNNLTIYKSNIDGDGVAKAVIERTRTTETDAELAFGASLDADGTFTDFGVGNINWCKIWHGDIGDDACRKLAVWPREKINMEACGFRKYYLTNNSLQRCAFTLLASNLLSKKYPWSNGANSNSGGWAKSVLNTMLNTRLYDAIPEQIKLLIKQVNVPSSLGDKSTEVDTTPCYITVPACIEVSPEFAYDPYINEGSAISYMVLNSDRRKVWTDGRYTSYWTRSPNVTSVNYVHKVAEDGSVSNFNIPYYEAGILIEISF